MLAIRFVGVELDTIAECLRVRLITGVIVVKSKSIILGGEECSNKPGELFIIKMSESVQEKLILKEKDSESSKRTQIQMGYQFDTLKAMLTPKKQYELNQPSSIEITEQPSSKEHVQSVLSPKQRRLFTDLKVRVKQLESELIDSKDFAYRQERDYITQIMALEELIRSKDLRLKATKSPKAGFDFNEFDKCRAELRIAKCKIQKQDLEIKRLKLAAQAPMDLAITTPRDSDDAHTQQLLDQLTDATTYLFRSLKVVSPEFIEKLQDPTAIDTKLEFLQMGFIHLKDTIDILTEESLKLKKANINAIQDSKSIKAKIGKLVGDLGNAEFLKQSGNAKDESKIEDEMVEPFMENALHKLTELKKRQQQLRKKIKQFDKV
jgi:hypothetical protein